MVAQRPNETPGADENSPADALQALVRSITATSSSQLVSYSPIGMTARTKFRLPRWSSALLQERAAQWQNILFRQSRFVGFGEWRTCVLTWSVFFICFAYFSCLSGFFCMSCFSKKIH
jgi:hypothetical protein